MTIKPHEMEALQFLAARGSDCIGVIDNEEKLAAALVFHEMKQKGLVLATISNDGPVYRLSNAGKKALEAA